MSGFMAQVGTELSDAERDLLRNALREALPGLRDLVAQCCPDPDVRARDVRVLALVQAALWTIEKSR